MEMIEKFPLLLTLAPVIAKLPDVPILMEKQKVSHGRDGVEHTRYDPTIYRIAMSGTMCPAVQRIANDRPP